MSYNFFKCNFFIKFLVTINLKKKPLTYETEPGRPRWQVRNAICDPQSQLLHPARKNQYDINDRMK